MNDANWDALENLLREARRAYYAEDSNRLCALVYMLKLGLDDVNRPIKGGIVHSSGAQEIQVEAIRADRDADRPGDPSRLYAAGLAS